MLQHHETKTRNVGRYLACAYRVANAKLFNSAATGQNRLPYPPLNLAGTDFGAKHR